MVMADALIVRAPPGAGHAHTTLDIAESQVLLLMEGAGVVEPYEHYVLLLRLRPGVWIIAGPEGDLSVDDLSQETEVIPLMRNGAFPAEGRPFLCHGHHTEAQIAALRAQAQRLGVIHDAAPQVPMGAAATQDLDTIWVFADPALPIFGQEVAVTIMATIGAVEIRGAVGLVKPPDRAAWTTMERLRRADLASWLVEKKEGPGRDRRLTGVRAQVGKPMPLFREAVTSFDPKATVHPIYEGPSALDEVCRSATSSGHEPLGFAAEFLRESSVNQRSGVAIEYMFHWWTLWAMAIHDGLDLRHSVAAENIGRRLLQQQRAIRRNAKAADFEHLEAYMNHCSDTRGHIKSTRFDQHVSQVQRDEAYIMKNQRLTREELEAVAKRKPAKKEGD